ncbi:MAG TPA: TetR/AcrR family transcriptional regulator [Solirubrobacteraceae bacterium]|jgi:AcrR family transcriptional regulator
MSSSAPQGAPTTTRDALAAAGLRRFAVHGYEGSRLVDIAADADLTTGAFYGHFTSKFDLFAVLFDRYGADLLAALDECATLEDQFICYIVVSRQYRGALRASAELLQRSAAHASARQRLRDNCAAVLAWRLREPLTPKRARVASRLLVDVLDQYAFMEAARLTTPDEPRDVAHALATLVTQGLYITPSDN